MVLFLLISVPLLYMYTWQLQDAADIARLRNPLVAGAAAFFPFALAASQIWPLFETDYLWGDTFLQAGFADQVLPFAGATALYALFYRKRFFEAGDGRQFAFFSFLASFMALLAIRDLIVSLDDLGPVELFLRPAGRLALLAALPWALARFLEERSRLPRLVLVLFLMQLLLGAASAWMRVGQAAAAMACLAPPLLFAALLLAKPGFRPAWMSRGRAA